MLRFDTYTLLPIPFLQQLSKAGLGNVSHIDREGLRRRSDESEFPDLTSTTERRRSDESPPPDMTTSSVGGTGRRPSVTFADESAPESSAAEVQESK